MSSFLITSVVAAGVAALASILMSKPPEKQNAGGTTTVERPAAEPDPYLERRERMVRDDIAGSTWGRGGVKDKVVLEAMRTVPRHKFVPDSALSEAYADHPLPIGYGQTISQPYIVAYMTAMLKPEKDAVVLEIGAGSGYQAAVLAQIVKQVYTVEIVPELAESAKKRLAALEYKNIEVRAGDGYNGWPEHAPFDAIIVTAAASHIPPPLVEQLKPGARMAIPVGPPFQVQQLMLVEKRQDGTVVQRSEMPVQFVPLLRRGD
jgi:protein-L-isoaspartate(D-aspartate) O-methyltransferase